MASNQPRAFRLPPAEADPARTAATAPAQPPRAIKITPDTSLDIVLEAGVTQRDNLVLQLTIRVIRAIRIILAHLR